MSTPVEQITGLVLAGGRGTRMGGADKGLASFHGEPLVSRAMRRLQPQVGFVMINANRHLEQYATLGAAVVPDLRDNLIPFPKELSDKFARDKIQVWDIDVCAMSNLISVNRSWPSSKRTAGRLP
jgi:molybdopterin-guanine dinucleotide biosynthesis protein A